MRQAVGFSAATAIAPPRWVVRRSMRDDIPDMLACLRGLIDASGEWDRDRDLKRCPRKGRDRN